MAFTRLPTTGSILWSRNTMNLQFVALLTGSANIVMEIWNDTALVTTLTYPILSANITIDLKRILSTFVEPSRPAVFNSAGALVIGVIQGDGIKNAKIYYRLSTAAAPGASFSCKILYGGVDNMNFVDEASINSYTTFSVANFFPQGRILSYVPSGRCMDAGEVGWITYFQEQPALAAQRILYYVTYLDGTVGVITKYFPEGADLTNTIWYIPIGVAQAGLDPLLKGVASMQMAVSDGGIGVGTTLATYNVAYDNRPLYTWIDVFYRNSLGGWDNFRFRGEIEFSTDSAKKEYTIKNNRYGSNPYFDSTVRLKWKANTGYISGQHMAALNDLLQSTDICLYFEGAYLPIRCTTKTLTWKDTKSGLYNEIFEFESSGDFNSIPRQLMQLFAKYPENR